MRLGLVAELLSKRGSTEASAQVGYDGGDVLVSLRINAEKWEAVGLHDELQHAIDMEQLRELCKRYDLKPADLEAFTKGGER